MILTSSSAVQCQSLLTLIKRLARLISRPQFNSAKPSTLPSTRHNNSFHLWFIKSKKVTNPIQSEILINTFPIHPPMDVSHCWSHLPPLLHYVLSPSQPIVISTSFALLYFGMFCYFLLLHSALTLFTRTFICMHCANFNLLTVYPFIYMPY